jgi:hypothetical protein
MKQLTMFQIDEDDGKYSKKIDAPVYHPRGIQPDIRLLCDDSKTRSLVDEIKASNIKDEEKEFLIKAAARHSVFYYEKIADFYCYASPEMQRLMERSGLVIIDFDSAIANGFVKICEDIRKQYLEEYEQ